MYASTSARSDRLGHRSVRRPCQPDSSQAAELIWEVENPFRLFKPTRSFALHETAFNGGARRAFGSAAGGHHLAHRAPTQRSRLQGCIDARPVRGDRRQALSAEPAGLGGPNRRRDLLREQRPLRGAIRHSCERKYSWGSEAKITCCRPRILSRFASDPSRLAARSGECIWSWQPRKPGAKAENQTDRPAPTSSPLRAFPLRSIAKIPVSR